MRHENNYQTDSTGVLDAFRNCEKFAEGALQFARYIDLFEDSFKFDREGNPVRKYVFNASDYSDGCNQDMVVEFETNVELQVNIICITINSTEDQEYQIEFEDDGD